MVMATTPLATATALALVGSSLRQSKLRSWFVGEGHSPNGVFSAKVDSSPGPDFCGVDAHNRRLVSAEMGKLGGLRRRWCARPSRLETWPAWIGPFPLLPI